VSVRIGDKQARLLLQLSAGYVIASAKDPYKALRAKGLVEDSTSYSRGDVEYERKNGVSLPRVTWEGKQALRRYVDRHGRLEIELQSPLADWTTVIRMNPKAVAA
jgi:hypothetical protein